MSLRSHAETHNSLYSEYELRNLPKTKVGVAKDRGKNYIKTT